MGGTPYPDLTVRQVVQFVSDGKLMSKPNEIPRLIYEIMLRCWQESPAERPTFVELQENLRALLDVSDQVSFIHIHIMFTSFITWYIGTDAHPLSN